MWLSVQGMPVPVLPIVWLKQVILWLWLRLVPFSTFTSYLPACSVDDARELTGTNSELGNGNLTQVPNTDVFFAGKDPKDTNPNIDWGFVTTPQAVSIRSSWG
jgi:hypothetical protein